MTDTAQGRNGPTEFLPKLLTVWREGYRLADLRADALAGLTVAIVALPLSMAIAIASGVGPERGLFTAIVGGFLVSALGGSRYQIGGPAGAFIVLVAACVLASGVQGLILATVLSGLILIAAGVLRLGTYIRYIPYPVTVGFTAGIAVIIFASQLREIFGLTLPGAEPGEILQKLQALWAARGTVSWAALAVAALTAAAILTLRRVRPHWPGMLIAVVLASVVVAGLGLPVSTIGGRFGDLPHFLPAPVLPDFTLWREALPWALSFALLGAIESLLSAVVADGMSGARHRSNAELVAQGVANIGSGLFGGFCVTGTIARTATNVRAGSRGPVSGILHSVFLLVFMLVAAPLAAYIPLAALAGVLAVVAWGMAERHELVALLRSSRGDALVVGVTFLLVVFRDLTQGIIVGFALAGLVFIKRMSETAAMRPREEQLDTLRADRVVYHLEGPYFFGAAAQLGGILDRIAEAPRALVLEMSGVPLIDSSGARGFHRLAARSRRRGGQLYLVGLSGPLRRQLEAQGLQDPEVRYLPDLAAVDRYLDAAPESS
ncbi:SulP family inorganic anion transporter [Tabrizicola sp.]|uniref:SulP family inorganic anion transporter n=1 Tax=Tabrizicola sp. TaxID=2005166 RepID=UPI0025D9D9A3|nr:SulP family inorganic anion transporter [Tabrizicola sp.]MBY0351596.1 SulP family inorganic anion transporter [Tabrizicola sp.]MDK2775073.1 SulP family inorganic anion transporter [Tabrizicola sp.]